MKLENLVIEEIDSSEIIEYECYPIVFFEPGLRTDSFQNFKCVFTDKYIYLKRKRMYLFDGGCKTVIIPYHMITKIEDVHFMKRVGIKIYTTYDPNPRTRFYFDNDTEKVKEIILTKTNLI